MESNSSSLTMGENRQHTSLAVRLIALPSAARYSIALAASLLAALLRLALEGVWSPVGYPLSTFYPAVMLSAWLGGIGPGLISTAISTIAAIYTEPSPSTSISAGGNIAALLVFITTGVFISVLNEAWRRGEAALLRSEQSERNAREQAEHAVAQLRGVQSITDIALSNLELVVLMPELLARLRTILRSETASLLLLDGNGTHLVLAAADGIRRETDKSFRIPISQGVAGQIAQSDRGMIIEDLANINVTSPFLRKHIKSLVGAPLRISGQLLGVIHVGSVLHRKFTSDDLQLLSLVAERIAIAIERARLNEAERAARISAEGTEGRLRLALEAGRMGTWEYQIGTGQVRWSPTLEQIHGFEPGTFPGTFEAFREEIYHDDRDRVLRAVGDAIKGLHDHHIEYRIVRRDGSVRWVEGRGQIFAGSSGQPERMIGVCTDITERKAAEESEQIAKAEAERANRIKDEFLTVLAHELRTPLASILGWAHILGSRELPTEKIHSAIQAIERSAKAATHLVDSLLDLSRIMSGKLHLEMHSLDVASIVNSAVEIVRPEAEAKALAINVTVPAFPVIVYGDSIRLQQVVWNLLSNALKFTPEGGRIEVRLAQNRSEASINVTDTGRGIRAEFLPYVFERFTQAEISPGVGLGLGLAIIRELVQSHNGSIRAYSPGEGRGSTFTVTLPLRTAAIEPVPEGPAIDVPTEAQIAGTHVLVVDDDHDTRRLLATILESHGAIVKSVASVAEALDAISRRKPNILLADLQMPDEDGYALVEKLRSREREAQLGRLPVIAVTACVAKEDRQRTRACGFDGHVAKPFEAEEIVRVVAEFGVKAMARHSN